LLAWILDRLHKSCASPPRLDWQKYVEVDPRYFRPAEVDILIGDATKAREKLGWSPKVSFRELVQIMVDADLADLKGDRATA
jgi:GDPmannose 4,6-dehydratase